MWPNDDKTPIAPSAFSWWLFVACVAGLTWVIQALAGVLF